MTLKFKWNEESIAKHEAYFGKKQFMHEEQVYREVRVKIQDGMLMAWAFKSSNQNEPEVMWDAHDMEYIEVTADDEG